MHPFLAERIISMLNYFLQHLVGPKMGALKVKDFSEFDFKPQQLVSDICTIYLNLGYVLVCVCAGTTHGLARVSGVNPPLLLTIKVLWKVTEVERFGPHWGGAKH